jgi:hypothetical protein
VLQKEEALNGENDQETVEAFEEMKEKIRATLLPKKREIDSIYTGATELEKAFFLFLSTKNAAIPEGVAIEGTPIAAFILFFIYFFISSFFISFLCISFVLIVRR